MTKLSKIFENINDKDTIKQKYYAEKIVDNFLLQEGKLDKAYDLEYIQDKIVEEAYKKESLNESLKFVDGIFKQINERFMDTIKDLGKSVKKGIKNVASAIGGKLKELWTGAGDAEKVIKKWHTLVTAEANKLDALVDSLILDDESYLFEKSMIVDVNGNNFDDPKELKTDLGDETETGEPVDTDGGDVDNGVDAMASKLFSGKKVETGKKTGSTQKRVKFYAITKSGVNSTLWVGPTNNIAQMQVLMTYMKSSNKMFLNLTKEVVETELEMNLISNLLLAIKNNADLNPDGVIRDVVQAGKKVVVDHNGKKVQIVPGRLIVMSISGKSKLPIKVKNSVSSQDFMKAFGIQSQSEFAPSGGADTDVSNNSNDKNYKGDAKPIKGEPGYEDETDEEYKDRLDDWSFGDDTEDDVSDKPSSNNNDESIPAAAKQRKEVIDNVLVKSGILKNDDGFYNNVGTTPAKTKASIEKFASENSYRISDMLKSANSEWALSAPENIAFMANMKKFITFLKDQPAQEGYNEKGYKEFLSKVSAATDGFDGVLDRLITFTMPGDDTEKEKIGGDSKASDTTSDNTEETPEITSSTKTKDELIKILDSLSNDELQYILSKVE